MIGYIARTCILLAVVASGLGFSAKGTQAETLQTVEANGITFSYIEEGQGPLILLFHGYPETARSWKAVQIRLAAAGYRVVAPFTRGYPPTEAAATAAMRSQTHLCKRTLATRRTKPRS